MSLDDWCDTELHDLEAIKSQEQRLYENEQNQTKEKFYNAGYKKGLGNQVTQIIAILNFAKINKRQFWKRQKNVNTPFNH